MTQHHTLNVKLANSQLHRLTAGIKNSTHVTINPSSNAASESNDEINFPYKLLLTNT